MSSRYQTFSIPPFSSTTPTTPYCSISGNVPEATKKIYKSLTGARRWIEIMSCNGCRVLRKGCSENCMLRQCLQCIDSPQAQGHATLFVAKFFGRAGLVSFVSNVPQSQRPALFQSLLFEAVGRTISPVSGAVGLLWSGNWRLCQAAVETVLRGGTISAFPELAGVSEPEKGYPFEAGSDMKKRKSSAADLDLCLTSAPPEKRRPATPSEESETTTLESGSVEQSERREGQERKLLRLFL